MAGALPVACLNGEFMPLTEARVSPLDRAFLFGDAVYEVVPYFNDRPLQMEAHLARLRASLDAVGIRIDLSDDEIRALIGEMARRNGGGNLVVYLQISRGTDFERAHVAARELEPTLFAMASTIPAWKPSAGIEAITRPDTRWARCDIKSTALLANVMQLAEARRREAEEALLLRDGELTEGTTTSVLVVEGGRLIRRPNSAAILPGTTTDLVVRARHAGRHGSRGGADRGIAAAGGRRNLDYQRRAWRSAGDSPGRPGNRRRPAGTVLQSGGRELPSAHRCPLTTMTACSNFPAASRSRPWAAKPRASRHT